MGQTILRDSLLSYLHMILRDSVDFSACVPRIDLNNVLREWDRKKMTSIRQKKIEITDFISAKQYLNRFLDWLFICFFFGWNVFFALNFLRNLFSC